MGAFSKASVQETPNVRKSDPDNFKFSYSEALNAAELPSRFVSLGKNALGFLFSSREVAIFKEGCIKIQ